MTQAKPYCRRLSGYEREHLVAARICPPFANQVVLEGNGDIDPSEWRAAVRKASEANPGSRLILKGYLGFCNWVDTRQSPPVKEVNGENWSGADPNGAPFLKEPLSETKGPTCEVLLIYGNPLRIIFRSLHAIMDGRGALTWMEDIFRALRGEPLIGSDCKVTVSELAKRFQQKTKKPIQSEHLAPTGVAKGSKPGASWRRRKIPGRYFNLLPQIAVTLAAEARQYANGAVRFGIPVDLRRRQKGLRSTSNLTSSIQVEVNPDNTPEQIAAQVFQELYDRQDAVLIETSRWNDFIPSGVLATAFKKTAIRQHASGLYNISGVISNLGKMHLDRFTGGGFSPASMFFIPPGVDYLPAFLTIAELENDVELAIAMPNVLASEGRLDRLIDRISAGLTPSGG